MLSKRLYCCPIIASKQALFFHCKLLCCYNLRRRIGGEDVGPPNILQEVGDGQHLEIFIADGLSDTNQFGYGSRRWLDAVFTHVERQFSQKRWDTNDDGRLRTLDDRELTIQAVKAAPYDGGSKFT